MSKIFLSYRHNDTAAACATIADVLRHEFGADRVFRDEQSLPYGQDYIHTIIQAIEAAPAMLVLIGPHWLSPENRQRLYDPADVVRNEVEMGMRRGIPIIPIFIDIEVPPIDWFPPNLQFLQQRHGVLIQSTAWVEGAAKIIKALQHYVADTEFLLRQFAAGNCIVPPVIRIPAGQCQLGSTDRTNEAPMHMVNVGAFAIAKYPVTVMEYDQFIRQTDGTKPPPIRTINWLSVPKHPVVNVTWQNATNYAAWLAYVTGQLWRLLTEAEWEKAAGWDESARRSRTYPWGDAFASTRCNTLESEHHQPIEVGKIPNGASAYGIHDMAGNVWEWTSSPYFPYPFAMQNVTVPSPPARAYVVRGGSWRNLASDARVARRANQAPWYYSHAVGFRLGFSTLS